MSANPTTLDLPEYDAWVGSDAWRDCLLTDHWENPREGCPGCVARTMLPAIHAAWNSGDDAVASDLWALQDGYGSPGFMPGQGFDWSGIRDSSPAAIARMWQAVR